MIPPALPARDSGAAPLLPSQEMPAHPYVRPWHVSAACSRHCGYVGNWLAHLAVGKCLGGCGQAVCRMLETSITGFQCPVHGLSMASRALIHGWIACYPYIHDAPFPLARVSIGGTVDGAPAFPGRGGGAGIARGQGRRDHSFPRLPGAARRPGCSPGVPAAASPASGTVLGWMPPREPVQRGDGLHAWRRSL